MKINFLHQSKKINKLLYREMITEVTNNLIKKIDVKKNCQEYLNIIKFYN